MFVLRVSTPWAFLQHWPFSCFEVVEQIWVASAFAPPPILPGDEATSRSQSFYLERMKQLQRQTSYNQVHNLHRNDVTWNPWLLLSCSGIVGCCNETERLGLPSKGKQLSSKPVAASQWPHIPVKVLPSPNFSEWPLYFPEPCKLFKLLFLHRAEPHNKGQILLQCQKKFCRDRKISNLHIVLLDYCHCDGHNCSIKIIIYCIQRLALQLALFNERRVLSIHMNLYQQLVVMESKRYL